MALTGSLLVLLLGPLLFFLVEKKRSLVDIVDGFVFISVGGLVLMHLLPELSSPRAIPIVIFACAGFLGPNLFESLFHKAESKIHLAALILGILGLIVHAGVDGAALVTAGEDSSGSVLPLAIIIHRLPVGLALWWLMRPRFHLLVTWTALLGMCVATVIGYMLGAEWYSTMHDGWMSFVQAFVAGSILHVVFFRVHFDDAGGEAHGCCGHSHDHVHSKSEKSGFLDSWPEASGNFLGIAVLVALLVLHASNLEVPHSHHHPEESADFIGVFLSLALKSAPALLIAYVGAIFLFGFLPSGTLRWLGAGSRFKQAVKGVTVGLPLPVCSCGILPFYRTIVEKGAPPAAALAFLIATPELGLDAFLISIPLLGTDFTIVRLVAAAVLALSVAWLLSGLLKQPNPEELESEGEMTIAERLSGGARYGLMELVDITGPWILFGLFLAAIAQPLLGAIPLELPGQLEIVLFALIGVIVYVCASGATPLVAVMIAEGVSPGAALAFLLTGPATNVSTFGVLAELHGKRFAFFFGSLTGLMAVLLAYCLTLFQDQLTLRSSDALFHEHGSWIQILCLVVLAGLLTFSILRKGARGFLGEIFGRGIS